MLPRQRIATVRFPLQGATSCLRAALVASLSFAVACVGSSGGEDTPGTAGSTGGGSTAGHGGTTGSAGTGQAGSSQAGTGGSSSGAGGTAGAGGTTGAAGNGGAGTTGGAGGGSAGTSGAGGSAGAAGAGPGDGGRGGSAGGGGRGGNGGTVGRGGDGGAGGRGGAGGSGGATGSGGAGTGGGGGGATGMSSGCGKTPGIASSMYNNGSTIAITVGQPCSAGTSSTCRPTTTTHKPYKLIIACHQLDGNDKQMYANGYYHLLIVSSNNAIFVAPNGQKNGAPCTGDRQRGWRVWLAQREQLGHRARRCAGEADRRQLLRRHESDLRERLELRRQHVLQDRVRATARRRDDHGLHPRSRHLLRALSSAATARPASRSRTTLPTEPRFGAELRRGRDDWPGTSPRRTAAPGRPPRRSRTARPRLHERVGLHDGLSDASSAPSTATTRPTHGIQGCPAAAGSTNSSGTGSTSSEVPRRRREANS